MKGEKAIYLTIERETFSMDQAAHVLGCSEAEFKSLVFDYKLLRPCIYTQFQAEFFEAKTVSTKIIKSGEDIGALYVDIEDDERRREKIRSLDLLGQFDENLADYEGVTWESRPPRLLYLNLTYAYIMVKDEPIPVAGQRVHEGEILEFDDFETFDGIGLRVLNTQTDGWVSIRSPEMFFSRQEIGRVLSLLKNENVSAPDMEWLNAALLQLLLDRRSFLFGNKTSYNSVAKHLLNLVYRESGLTEENLRKELPRFHKLLG